MSDDFDGVPDDFAIYGLSSCGSEDAKQANNSCRWIISRTSVLMYGGKLTEDEWDYDGLDVLCTRSIRISRKVGDVQAKSGVVPQYSIQIYKRLFR